MQTTKPIATISYNSYQFLRGKLDDLVKNQIILWYVFIEHMPEDDEKKKHFHVYMEPAKRVDTLWLRTQFTELDPNNKNPRCCLPIVSSKFIDWYWYDLHDPAYLMSKGQSRKYHYTHAQMISNEQEYLDEMARCNPNPCSQIMKAYDILKRGGNPFDVAVALNIKLKDMFFYLKSFNEFKDVGGFDYLNRATSTNHEEIEQIELKGDDE